jgi:hypothetical protein
MFLYHRGNLLYFEGNRSEAIKVWCQSLELCRSNNYIRGQFRLLYFIGRAYHDLNFKSEGEFYYKEALSKASSVGATRFIERIDLNLNNLKDSINSFSKIQNNVLLLIEKKNIQKAKKLTLFTCRVRRYEKRNWGAESEWILLCWVLFAENKMNRFFKVFNQIDDEYIKIHILNSLPLINKNQYDSNCTLQNIKSLILQQSQISSSNRINDMNKNHVSTSISLSNDELLAENHLTEVEKLIYLLKCAGSVGLTMESICNQIWNYGYEPDIHSHRVYLLITKVRKYFGASKAVLNSYGGKYKLNPLLINRFC